MSSYYSRKLKFVDRTLLSGSGDPLRTALGAGWIRQNLTDTNSQISQHNPDSIGRTVTVWGGFEMLVPLNDYIDFRTSTNNTLDFVRDIAYDSKVPVPIIKYPVRLYGDNETIYSDLHWQKYLIGGEYDDQEYNGIFSTEEYTDHWFTHDLQYDPVLIKTTIPEKLDSYQKTNISYEYNHYYKNYEKQNSELDSELLIPNGYALQNISQIDELNNSIGPIGTAVGEFANSLYGNNLVNFISRERKFSYTNYSNIFYTKADYESIYAGDMRELTYAGASTETKKYFEYYYPLHHLSSSTEAYIQTKFKNILIDHKAVENEYSMLYNNRLSLPYYSRISLPGAGGNIRALGDSIIEQDVSGKFLLTLKQMFVDNSLESKPSNVDFTVQETGHLDPAAETNKIYDMTMRSTTAGEIFTEMRINYINYDDDFYCVGDPTEPTRVSLYDKTGDYRHLNTITSTKALADFIDDVDSDSFLETIRAPYGDSSFNEKESEILAYRIEKIGGPPTGDLSTQNVIQNFFIFNSIKLKDDFLDTQIKYGEEYTYNIYAYVAVKGYRYQASDLRITRVISDLTDPDTPDSWDRIYCLEFFDPETGDRKDKLVQESLGAGETAVDNRFATDAQIASIRYKHLADFNVTIQPSVKIIEIPVASSTIRVMDHPVSPAAAIPFHVNDNSQRLGFDIDYRAFEKFAYPITLSVVEDQIKNNYLASNNLLVNEPIEEQSRSSAQYLEIYRMDERPTNYKNFEGKKIASIDLAMWKPRIPADEDGIPQPSTSEWWENKDMPTYNDYVYYDTVDTNRKYYYTMRFLNERSEPGHFSPIYIAELLNDGGYKYGVFDVIYPYQLEVDVAVNTTKQFKKLLNIVPHLQHAFMDDSEVDYSKSAFSQLEKIKIGMAEHNLWNKAFKIRLTSKKTGKKIDLNITYKMSRG
tara:strand:- start:327 stop:3101 length:2775 start_codon:yes stop_codon:yes gene_type:complete